jgi:hypothetical protein
VSPKPSTLIQRISIAVALAAALVAIGPRLARAESELALRQASWTLSKEMDLVARGIETGLQRNDLGVAKRLFHLEVQSAALIQRAAEQAHASGADPDVAIARQLSVHEDILRLQERVLEHTLAELDRALPGEPLRELWARDGVDLYRPLLRSDTPDPDAPPPDAAQRRAALARMERDFVEAGGKPEDLRPLGRRFLDDLGSGQLFEWAEAGPGNFRATTAGAKHPLIARSGRRVSVQGAGSAMVYKDARGEVLFAVVSSSSGNYKPGIGSVYGLMSELEQLGVPRGRLLETKVLPGEPVLVKLLMKAKGASKEAISAELVALKQTATPPPTGLAARTVQQVAVAAAVAPEAARTVAKRARVRMLVHARKLGLVKPAVIQPTERRAAAHRAGRARRR